MWTVIYMAQNRTVADGLKSILEQAGILVRLMTKDGPENTGEYYEVLVPESSVEAAHSLMIEQGY